VPIFLLLALFHLVASPTLTIAVAQSQSGQSKDADYKLEGEKKIAEEGIGTSQVATIYESSKGGWLFSAPEIPTILPPLTDDLRKWSYQTYCTFRQHATGIVAAYIDTSNPKQKIYWRSRLAFDSDGKIKVRMEVPLWADGMLHEFEGTVVLGDSPNRHVFQSAARDRLVFRVSRQRGYVYERGQGTVTLPSGNKIRLPAEKPEMVIGKP
jgi:hypothetical protein